MFICPIFVKVLKIKTVLLLSDNNTKSIQTLIDRLTPINITVTYILDGIYKYEGKPNASEFDIIILMPGAVF